MTKRIGILTSGGDAPGMNAAVRAVVRKGIYDGYEVFGIRYGYRGLAEGDIFQMKIEDVSETLSRGGTMLFSARYAEFASQDGLDKGISQLKKFQIDTLVVIGGDGTYRGAQALAKAGIKTIGIPGTIDNDIPLTDFTIGFDTACNTALDAVDKIRDTATSHIRTFIVEVMGRYVGDIAFYVGIGSGAEQIIIPEADFDIESMAKELDAGRKRGKKHNIIILAEGVMSGAELAEKLEAYGNYHTRVTVLGHVQRGGSPSARDRLLASMFGHKAVTLINAGKHGIAVGIEGTKVTYHSFENVLDKAHLHDYHEIYDINREISY